VEDRRRNRVMKILKGAGFHVQKSVFECILSEAAFTRLRKRLEKEIDLKSDSIRIYRLCGECRKQIEVLGKGEVSEVLEVKVI